MKELRGMPVVTAMLEKIKVDVEVLAKERIIPTLAIIRIGENADDLSYERGAVKRFNAVGAKIKVVNLPVDCTQTKIETVLLSLNNDTSVHGILVFRPLPKHLFEENLKKLISPQKDVDCFGSAGYASLFMGDGIYYPPCTPQAVIEMINYYGINVSGKRVVVVGRSLVVGKPLAVMLIAMNATVTVCHTKTVNLSDECRRADIIIAAAGSAKMIKENYVGIGQTVIDVGINMVDDMLCGDVDYEAVSPIIDAVTPVPGGVGTVTTAVLLSHTVKSAKMLLSQL